MGISKTLAVASAALGSLVASSANALTLELRNLGGVETGSEAHAGFVTAAHFWEAMLTNDVSVKVNVGFSPLSPGVLGATASTTDVAAIGHVLPALQASAGSALDAIAAANLPDTRPSAFVGGQAIDALVSAPQGDGAGLALPLSRILDADASANNSALLANTAVMKALGLTPTYTADNAAIGADGSVAFNSALAFDFDPSDGIDAGKIDFVGVAIHEIGHALGFRSGVDIYDVNATDDLDGFAVMSVLDLFRYSERSAALGLNDWAVGGELEAAPYFSIDGGATPFGGRAWFSTGRFNGDGSQASHWKDFGWPPIGLLDPTVVVGRHMAITSTDLAAFDAMGWSVRYDVLARPGRSISTKVVGDTGSFVPEPEAWSLMLAGFFMTGVLIRARRRALARP